MSTPEPSETVRHERVTPDEDGMRLDRWFKARFPELGFSALQRLVRTGQIRVDGGRVKASTRLSAGQTVRVPPLAIALTESEASRGPAAGHGSDAAALEAMTLYADDAVFVFDKPPGLAVQGGSGLTRHVDQMLEALRDKRGQKPRLVHRLDRDTSGVLLVARTRLAAARLAESFRARSTRKIYWALVKGVPKPAQGRIATFLAKETDGDLERMAVTAKTEESQKAVSLYSVVDRAAQSLAWLTMRPVTGRTHQLRVHAAHIGHPIIGDPKYVDPTDRTIPGGIQNKLHLHARRLTIPHPDGGTLDITAPLPEHMRQSWNLLGFDPDLGRDASDLEE